MRRELEPPVTSSVFFVWLRDVRENGRHRSRIQRTLIVEDGDIDRAIGPRS
jgi:hypothetical protein